MTRTDSKSDMEKAVQECHDRKSALLEALTQLDDRQELDQTDYDELEQELRAHFRTSWQTIMTRQISPTRQILGKLFNGNRIPLTPVHGPDGSYYEFNGMASIGRLVTGRAKGLVSPTGFSIKGNEVFSFSIDVLAYAA